MPKDIPSDQADFAIQLRAYVTALPGGAKRAAEIAGVTKRTINLWLAQKGRPAVATQVGTLALLSHHLPPQTTHEKST